MMGTTLEKRHVFTIKEACINGVNVDFYPKQHLEKISEKYGFRTVLFLEKQQWKMLFRIVMKPAIQPCIISKLKRIIVFMTLLITGF